MRYAFTVMLLLSTLTLAACSFSTDFAVVNASGEPIEITYRIGEAGLVGTGRPAALPAAQIGSRGWQELPPTQYRYDLERRTVTTSLGPGMALRVNQGAEWDENYAGDDFIIQELIIKGAGGEITLKGGQVYKSFVAVSRPFYAYGPDTTLLVLTYR